MDIQKIYEELDNTKYTEIEPVIKNRLAEAADKGLWDIQVCLLNELIGYYRDTTRYDDGAEVAKELIRVLNSNGQEGTLNEATSLINIANFYRANGNLEESIESYKRTEAIYANNLDTDNYLFAGLYNNMALTYQDMRDYESAVNALTKALTIVSHKSDMIIECATTYTNLAISYMGMDDISNASKAIESAEAIFLNGHSNDYHYAGLLAVKGDLLMSTGDYESAAKAYNSSAEMIRSIMGDNDNVQIMMEKANKARELMNPDSDESVGTSNSISGLDLCESYYNEYGAPMIHELFPDWEDRIAVGLVGEGSECFGLDDEMSRDHDWGPGFCMWVTDETYAYIGRKLMEAYEALPTEYMGYSRYTTPEAASRLGVHIIDDFYRTYEETAEESMLATITNGRIFRDDEGIFSNRRQELMQYYSYELWTRKLGISLIHMGQTGQYNLKRALDRGDKPTAIMYLGQYIKYACETLYLINHEYAPYDKLLVRGAGRLSIHPEIADIMTALSDMDIADPNVLMTIEIVATIIRDELILQGQLPQDYDNYYLEKVGRFILDSPAAKESLVETVIKREWDFFDKTVNEGGRAECQDNWPTFYIMRKSQYNVWDEKLLADYLRDISEATYDNWNLITEKYGRMEASTAPEEYEKIASLLPMHTQYQDMIIEGIVELQVSMMEEIADKYPKLAGNARVLRTADDTEYDTSYETYLRGELGTYSLRTLIGYGRLISEFAIRRENLPKAILENTAKLYGFASIEECERKL